MRRHVFRAGFGARAALGGRSMLGSAQSGNASQSTLAPLNRRASGEFKPHPAPSPKGSEPTAGQAAGSPLAYGKAASRVGRPSVAATHSRASDRAPQAPSLARQHQDEPSSPSCATCANNRSRFGLAPGDSSAITCRSHPQGHRSGAPRAPPRCP